MSIGDVLVLAFFHVRDLSFSHSHSRPSFFLFFSFYNRDRHFYDRDLNFTLATRINRAVYRAGPYMRAWFALCLMCVVAFGLNIHTEHTHAHTPNKKALDANNTMPGGGGLQADRSRDLGLLQHYCNGGCLHANHVQAGAAAWCGDSPATKHPQTHESGT